MASKASKRRRKRRRAAAPGASRSAADPGTEDADAGAVAPPEQRPRPQRSARRRGNVDDERPPAPWGSFPLVELAILVGIVMLLLGFIFVGGERGSVLIVTGLALCSIGGLELSIREHFAGYRSHTLILAGAPAVVVLAILFYAGPDSLPPLARAAIAAAVFAAAAILLTRVFRARSGGYSFRFSGLRRR